MAEGWTEQERELDGCDGSLPVDGECPRCDGSERDGRKVPQAGEHEQRPGACAAAPDTPGQKCQDGKDGERSSQRCVLGVALEACDQKRQPGEREIASEQR